MGNYYQGDLFIQLKKELPKSIILFLKNELCSDKRKINIPKKYLEYDCFKKENFRHIRFEFGYLYQNKNSNLKNLIDIPYQSIDSYTDIDCFKKDYQYIDNYIKIYINIKNYENHIESFLQFIKPFISEHCDNYLGKIKDEDDTYNKSFYVNNEITNQSRKNEILSYDEDCLNYNNEILNQNRNNEIPNYCDECLNYNNQTKCIHQDFCKKAYEKGIKDSIVTA